MPQIDCVLNEGKDNFLQSTSTFMKRVNDALMVRLLSEII